MRYLPIFLLLALCNCSSELKNCDTLGSYNLVTSYDGNPISFDHDTTMIRLLDQIIDESLSFDVSSDFFLEINKKGYDSYWGSTSGIQSTEGCEYIEYDNGDILQFVHSRGELHVICGDLRLCGIYQD